MWLPLGGAGLLVVGLLVGISLQGARTPLVAVGPGADGSDGGRIGSIEEILRYVEAKYVDEVDREALIDGAINNLLGELDPHTTYIPPAQVEAHRAQLEGRATGIGVDVLMIRDSLTIVSALPGGPAEAAGLQAYDRIVSIADSTVSGRSLSAAQVEGWMASQPEGPLAVEVFRPGRGVLLPVTLARERLTIPSVPPGIVLDGDIAYIKVRQFASNTYDEFMAQLERLTLEGGARHLIVDLRGNSGGYLQEAVSLLSQLFPEQGRLLVYTEGRHSPRKDYETTGRVFFPVDKVAVLIDNGSASASEIVAGAVQDWDRGTIVGRRSFGKGLVQELYPLRGGGALHITVSRYFTPSGRSIQRDYGDLGAYRLGGTNDEGLDSVREGFATSGGRPVYGGGGIAPDVEVPEDWRRARPTYVQAVNAIEPFAFEAFERAGNESTVESLLPLLRSHLAAAGLAFEDADWTYYQRDFARELGYALTAKREGATAAAARRALDDPDIEAALEAIHAPQPLARER